VYGIVIVTPNIFYEVRDSCSWVRHYFRGRKEVGTILLEVNRFFNLRNTSSPNMALGSTETLTKRVPRIFLGERTVGA
jgi:hypothetical protein